MPQASPFSVGTPAPLPSLTESSVPAQAALKDSSLPLMSATGGVTPEMLAALEMGVVDLGGDGGSGAELSAMAEDLSVRQHSPQDPELFNSQHSFIRCVHSAWCVPTFARDPSASFVQRCCEWKEPTCNTPCQLRRARVQ